LRKRAEDTQRAREAHEKATAHLRKVNREWESVNQEVEYNKLRLELSTAHMKKLTGEADSTAY
jgi:hypothetical protein